MKTIYETFAELSHHFTDGNSTTHVFSDHSDADCMAWQQGVREFARYLDEKGYRVTRKEDPITEADVRDRGGPGTFTTADLEAAVAKDRPRDAAGAEAVREERERAERIGRAILSMPDGTELRRNSGGGWKYVDPPGVDYGYYEALEDAICVQRWKPRWETEK